MNFLFSEEQEALRTAIAKLSAAFDHDYWLARDSDGAFPHDFHQELILCFIAEKVLGMPKSC